MESVIVAANLKTITWQHLVSTASLSPEKRGTGRRGSLAADSWVWLWMTKRLTYSAPGVKLTNEIFATDRTKYVKH